MMVFKKHIANKIKWGVIGSGGIAKRRTIPEGIKTADNAELSAVFDIDKDINAEIANEYNTIASNNIEALLSTDINAVYIATPVNLHREHVILCAKAGKHILCEKPLGIKTLEIEDMISECNNNSVLLGIAFMMRFHAQHQAALNLIRQGRIGKPVYARAQLSCWYPPAKGLWRQNPELGGGGSLLDLGGHCIDLLEMFFGEIIKVSCFINNTVHNYKVEDSAAAILFYKNGAMAAVDTFFCIPDNSSRNVLELYGSKGSIIAKGTIGQGEFGEMTAFLEDDDKTYNTLQTRAANSGMSISPKPVNMYKAEIEEFSRAIIENRKPENSEYIGLRSQKILSACYESAKCGKVITV